MGRAIAIIGMAGRFPGASSVSEYWDNLVAGRESVTFLTDDELMAAGAPPSLVSDKRYVKAAPMLEGVDLFDSELFAYSKKEADILDPQHRLLLECAWETLEDAGRAPNASAARIGVFAGSAGAVTSYLLACLAKEPSIQGATGGLEHLGNDKDFLTTRVSYELNLTGPSVAVQTACSTSLVAVHLACQSILVDDCDMALAGGVSVRIPQAQGYSRRHGDIYSSDGHCRAFDARATGIVFGSGVGLVLLKRLDAALRDGDPIRAVILGTALDNDGGKKISYTASSATGQAACMELALRRAGVDPRSLGFVEAHGTGTLMGDPVEVSALARVFRKRTAEKQFCAIGSVKNNVGHLDTAAGIASLIKTVLVLEHGRIPPVINFETPNPRIDFQSSPFLVNTAPLEWKRGPAPRRAGVNSLGIGGTNAFAVLEEAPRRETPARTGAARRALHALCLSARGPEALADYARSLSSWLEAHPEADPADFCFTVSSSRSHLPLRQGFVGKDALELARALGAAARRPETARRREGEKARVVFLFSDAPERAADTARQLAENDPAFRAEWDRLADAGSPLTRLQLALVATWKAWGVLPVATLGVGEGEAAAAAVASASEDVEPLPAPASGGALDLPALHAMGFRDFLEIGPGGGLLASASALAPDAASSASLTASIAARDGEPELMSAVAALASVGAGIDWEAVDGRERKLRLRLPTYPFRRRRHWIE